MCEVEPAAGLGQGHLAAGSRHKKKRVDGESTRFFIFRRGGFRPYSALLTLNTARPPHQSPKAPPPKHSLLLSSVSV